MTEQIPGIHVWLVLWKAFVAVRTKAEASLKTTGLGVSDFGVLEVLLNKGPLPVNAIGPKVHLTPGSISVAVDRLYEKGLVSRTEHEEDRRVRVVDLTPSGRTLSTQLLRQHEAHMELVAEVLSSAERAQLTELLKKLGRYAEAITLPT